MESVHCFRCYRFPSKMLDFYITSCMHTLCAECRKLCLLPSGDSKCIECKFQPARLVKIGHNMPEQVKRMFTPLKDDLNQHVRELSCVITFQQRQRHNLVAGVTKRMKCFDKLRDAYNAEKTKKENYKKQLEHAFRIIQSKESEIMDLKQTQFDRNQQRQAPPPTPKCAETMTTPSMVKVFSDSMYHTPRQPKERKERKMVQEIPPFMRSRSKTAQPVTKAPEHVPPPESFKTPVQPKKTSMGFTTPANPPHMFPYLKKLEQFAAAASQKAKQQHSQ